jgi:RNA polymerase sigma-70 factor (ECF subfamily)
MIMAEPAARKATKESQESAPAAASPPQPDEAVLVKRARQGDLGAYDELIRRYQERIYATVYHMTSNHEDANDLAQEAFIKGYQALKSFKGGSSFYTWVYRIAVNKTINFLKQRKNKAHMSLDDLDLMRSTIPTWSPWSRKGLPAGKSTWPSFMKN